MLTSYTKEAVKRHKADESRLSFDHYRQIASLLAEGTVGKDALVELIGKVSASPQEKVSKVAKEAGLELLSDADLQDMISKIIKENRALIDRMGDKAVGPLTGRIMAKAKGRADAKKVSSILAKAL